MYLNEIKCVFNLEVAGFNFSRSAHIAREENRGGVVVLAKHYLWSHVVDTDYSP